MHDSALVRTAGWGFGVAAAAGLQVWWWTGGGPAWLPVLTGPALVASTLGVNREGRRRGDPERAGRAALASGGLVGARQG